MPGVVGVAEGLFELLGGLPLVEVSVPVPLPVVSGELALSEPQAMATNPAPANTRLTAANDLERSKRLMTFLR